MTGANYLRIGEMDNRTIGNAQNIFIQRFPMDILHPRKLFLPALIIVAVIFTLLIFIGFSTYWNLNRARTNALTFVHQQGVATLQIIDASVLSLIDAPDFRQESIDRLIRIAGNNQYIEFVRILDPKGRIMHSLEHMRDEPSGEWILQTPEDGNTFYRIRELPGKASVYEIAQRIRPFNNDERRDRIDDPDLVSRILENKKAYNNAILMVGLEMSTFKMAEHEDFHHAIIMVSILSVLALGTMYFIFVIHRYYLMNRRLQETQEYTRLVVENMASGLLSVDDKGNVLAYNHLALEYIGQKSSAMEGFNLQQVIDFQSTGISETLSQCTPVLDREIRIHMSNGEDMPLALSVTPIRIEDGDCQGAVIILRDLREIKRLEEKVRRVEKFAALGKLAAAVAHEIRNPLSSIRGFAKFLSHQLQDRPQDQEYAGVMVKEVDRINRVVTDLLNFARPLDLEPGPVNPVELVEHIVHLVKGDAGSQDVNILVKTDRCPETVFLDQDQITQALLNLSLNALQASSPGQTIEIGAELDNVTNEIMFWLEDNGPGIPEENLKKVFDPFFTTRAKGTGLGLAIVQKIVENHRGSISVISPLPGKKNGCRFVIFIPGDLATIS